MGNEKVAETPLQKSLRRTGACVVAACDCSVFAYTRTLDGFRTCFCAHTQHAHEFGDAS